MTNYNCVNNKPDANRTADAIGYYGAGGALLDTGTLVNGELIIGDTASNPLTNTIASADATVSITNGAGTINLASVEYITGNSGFLVGSASTANATGDGTVFVIPFDTETYDIGNDFDTGTYTFTAPDTGKYYLETGCFTFNLGAGHTVWNLELVTSNRTYILNILNGAAARNSTTDLQFIGGLITDMDSGDTAYTQITVSNSTKTVRVGSTVDETLNPYFSGMRIF